MLNTQESFLKYIEEVLEKTKDVAISKDSINSLRNRMETTELIVPVVGGFSAGKSTLINLFLENNILSTKITPETALATELRYSNEQYIEAIKKDNEIDRYDISKIEELKEKASEYKYVKLHLNNQKLKEIEPLVLVDMPGFDAPIEHHNEAILNYLSKGIYFIVLTSLEDGNITKSMIREISNIMEVGKDFSFCLSKVNLKPENEVKQIQDKIQEQLEDYFDFEKKVVLIGNESGVELEKILKDIDVENLFQSIFIEDLKFNQYEIENSLNTIISTYKTSKEESSKIIKELTKSIDNILNKKEQLIEEVEDRYTGTNIDGIVNKVSTQLNIHKDDLVSYATSNQELFSQELNSIIKNTIISETKSRIETISSEFINNFNLELKNLDDTNFALDKKWIDKISENTKKLLEKLQNGMNEFVKEQKDSSSSGSSLYKILTTILGVTTSIVNPLMELVLIFLPEIIGYFTNNYKDSKQKDLIRNKLDSEVFPSIKSKLRSELPNLFNEYLKNTIKIISNKYETKISEKKDEITITQKQKEEEIENIEIELQKIENVKKDIQSLATNILYK